MDFCSLKNRVETIQQNMIHFSVAYKTANDRKFDWLKLDKQNKWT